LLYFLLIMMKKILPEKTKKLKEKRAIRMNCRLTKSEDIQFKEAFHASGFKKKSAFIRQKLLSKNGTNHLINQNNIQKIILETARLRTSLIKIGTNFNQLMTAINTFKKVELRNKDYQVLEHIDLKIEEVMELFKSLSELSNYLERGEDVD